MKKKKNKNIIILIVILIIVVLGVCGFLIFNKASSKDNTKPSDNTEENPVEENIPFSSYIVGEKVNVKLSNSDDYGTFYVLKQSPESEEYLTLFAESNIGTGAFNNDFSKGNEFKGSSIEKKLNELTSFWTNVKEKRLITVDEIKKTGLIETKSERRCLGGNCEPEDYTYVKDGSFLLYPGSNFEANHLYESYWTMTKVDDSQTTGNTNRYVYYVHLSGSIDVNIVGAEPGTDEQTVERQFSSFGIRPVIVVSKKYVNT